MIYVMEREKGFEFFHIPFFFQTIVVLNSSTMKKVAVDPRLTQVTFPITGRNQLVVCDDMFYTDIEIIYIQIKERFLRRFKILKLMSSS